MRTDQRYYTEEEKTRWVNQWLSVGQQSRMSFARQHGIPYTTFKFWVRKHQQSLSHSLPTIKKEEQASLPSFVSIQVEGNTHNTTVTTPTMELVLSNGSRISFYQPVSADYIRSLIK